MEQLSAVSTMKLTAMLILSQSKQFWSNTFEQFIEDVKDLTDINVKCKVLFQDSTGEETTKVIQQLSRLRLQTVNSSFYICDEIKI